MMIRILLSSVLALALLAGATEAACYADYKAKREGPLKLHYGVMKIDISPCAMSDKAKAEVAGRLASAGWKLLQVQSVFDDTGLDGRKQDAGEYFLRF